MPPDSAACWATAHRLSGEDNSTWSAAGVGYPREFHVAALPLMLGGDVRVGLEDSLRVRRRENAASNVDLVEKAVSLAAMPDRERATSAEARQRLALKGAGAVAL